MEAISRPSLYHWAWCWDSSEVASRPTGIVKQGCGGTGGQIGGFRVVSFYFDKWMSIVGAAVVREAVAYGEGPWLFV